MFITKIFFHLEKYNFRSQIKTVTYIIILKKNAAACFWDVVVAYQ